MTLRCRVIPCLDVTAGRVVKGTRFVDLVDEGDPATLAARYDAEGADEVTLLDIGAAPEGRRTLLEVVRRVSRRLTVPLTVGGGVRSVADMRSVLRAGADKVTMNTAAVRDPSLVADCARRFGRQAVVVAIDARMRPRPGPAASPAWEVVVRGGRDATGIDAVAWARQAADAGAGELLVTSIDRDGTHGGYDVALLRAVSDAVGVPVVASGGAAGPADLVSAVLDGRVDAVLAASIFHRGLVSIGEAKAVMAAAGIPVRRVQDEEVA
jgi:cyclase